MKKLLVLLCLALCMVLLVCSCGGNTDTDTDTSAETVDETDTNKDTDGGEIDLNDGKYRLFVCDEDGKGIANLFVQFCKDDLCDFGSTDANGYVEIPSGEYHIAFIADEAGNTLATYDESNYPGFEGDSKLITITLTKN